MTSDGRPRGQQNTDDYEALPGFWDSDYSWRVFANPYVSSVQFLFSTIQLDQGDQLWLGNLGNPIAGQHPVPYLTASQPLTDWRSYGYPLRYIGDATLGASDRGFEISSVLAQCGVAGPSSFVPEIPPLSRLDGLLLDTGDTVYFAIPGGVDPTLVLMQGLPSSQLAGGSPAVDFDVYARDGALPERDKYDVKAVTPSASEYIWLPSSSSGHTYYVAVTSYRGSGSFRIRWSRVKSSERYNISIGTEDVQSPAEMSKIAVSVRVAMREMFAATEGQAWMRWVDVYNEGGCSCGGASCDVCLSSDWGDSNDRSNCSGLRNGHITLKKEDWLKPDVIVHELGHCRLGLVDEYGDHHNANGDTCESDAKCFFSLMGGESHSVDFCTPPLHGKIRQTLGGVVSTHVCTISPSIFGVCGNDKSVTDCDQVVASSGCSVCRYDDANNSYQGGGDYSDDSAWTVLQNSGVVTDVPSGVTPPYEEMKNAVVLDSFMHIQVH